MKGALHILSMIEGVTVSDNEREKLDEIDARFWCYLNGMTYGMIRGDLLVTIPEGKPLPEGYIGGDLSEHGFAMTDVDIHLIADKKYTRSLDALKSAYPDGWLFSIEARLFCDDLDYKHGFYGHGTKPIGDTHHEDYVRRKSSLLRTDCLALMHAVVQAHEYDRLNP